jgi:formiminotetrahydrofolate cyclodeaminase
MPDDTPKRYSNVPEMVQDLSEDPAFAKQVARRIRHREKIERRLLRAMRRDVKIFHKIVNAKRK